jgi:hypothetical protein
MGKEQFENPQHKANQEALEEFGRLEMTLNTVKNGLKTNAFSEEEAVKIKDLISKLEIELDEKYKNFPRI